MIYRVPYRALIPLAGLAVSLLASTTMAQTAPASAPPEGAGVGEQAERPAPTSPWQNPALRPLLAPGLETFESDNDFRRYVARTEAARHRWARR